MALPHKTKAEPLAKALQGVTLPEGFYQWKSCRQIMMFLSFAKADEKAGGFTFTFGYVESNTNLGKRLTLSLNNFEQALRVGTLIKIQ